MLLISHGLGIYSLYAHCSHLLVKKGEFVNSGSRIAKTGETGYALGDHLHFSIIIQGRYVNPSSWMSAGWLKENINKLIDFR